MDVAPSKKTTIHSCFPLKITSAEIFMGRIFHQLYTKDGNSYVVLFCQCHSFLCISVFVATKYGCFVAFCVCAQSCLTLCNPMDCSLPGSSICGIFQARILEWVAISYSTGSSRPRDQNCVSCVSCLANGFFFTTVPPGKFLLHF